MDDVKIVDVTAKIGGFVFGILLLGIGGVGLVASAPLWLSYVLVPVVMVAFVGFALIGALHIVKEMEVSR